MEKSSAEQELLQVRRERDTLEQLALLFRDYVGLLQAEIGAVEQPLLELGWRPLDMNEGARLEDAIERVSAQLPEASPCRVSFVPEKEDEA